MDSRHTLSVNETFLNTLLGCKAQKEKAAMIVDSNGLTRIEGFIREICLDTPDPYLELDNGSKVLLQTIVAVNGIFLPSYSEC